jgi:hypothetical protein
VGLERGPFSLVSINEELLECKINGFGLENRDCRPWGPAVLITKTGTKICRPVAVAQSAGQSVISLMACRYSECGILALILIVKGSGL